MNATLRNHYGKYVSHIPDGLRELCADISREVIRSQPDDVYCFIADYLDTLFITRENAKVAVQIVQSVTNKSEHIVEILVGTGLRLEEIAAVAPRLQKAFKVYLNANDEQETGCGCDDDILGGNGKDISLCEILLTTGASYRDAQLAASKIQALFRRYREQTLLAESRGEVQWQRAAAKTVDLLRKSGLTRVQASYAATTIQAAYRGYYTRKNLRIGRARDGKGPKGIVDMCAWYRQMIEESGITSERANRAAIVIQTAYRKHLKRKSRDQRSVSLEISKETLEPSERSEDATSEGSEDHESSVKSHSEMARTEDELDDDAKLATEATEEQAQVQEVIDAGAKPLFDTSDAVPIEDVDQVADEVEDQSAKEPEGEENTDGDEQDKEHDEVEENEEEPVVEAKNEDAEE